MHESEKWKWSCSVVSDSSRPHGLQPTRFLCPWGFPGKSTGVGCHCLLWLWWLVTSKLWCHYCSLLKPQMMVVCVSRSVVSDSSRPHGLQPTRFLRAWDFPGKSTGVGCHCLLHLLRLGDFNYTLWFLGQTGLTKFTPAWPEPPYVERQLALLLWLLIGSLFESCYSTSLYFISSYLKWREYLPSGLRCSEEHSAKCRDSVSCQLFRRKL